MSEEITLKIKKDDLWKYSTFFLLAVVVIGAIFMFTGSNNTTQNPTVTQGNTQADTVSIDFKKVLDSISGPVIIGSNKAPVTIFEFTDFSCPYCAAASGDNAQYTAYMQTNQPGWEPPVSNIIKDYVESGKVRLAIFYTRGHSGGAAAQNVAWCLNDQSTDLYLEFYQKAFAAIDDTEDATKMKALAKTISGVNSAKLDSCLASDKYADRFDQEQTIGANLGMSGTPGFIVGKSGGEDSATVVRGAYPYSTFQPLIESRL